MKRLVVFVTILAFLASISTAGTLQTRRTPKQQPQKNQPELKQKSQQSDEQEALSGDEGIRIGTDLVNVLFTVTDSNNRVINDINQEDLVVLEDGQKQELFTFKREANLPIRISLLIDVSGSQEYTFPEEKRAAAYFLHSIIRPNKDLASVLTFQDDVELVQGLTSRMETLNRALDDIQYSRRFGSTSSRNQATALFDAVYITADEVLGREEDRGSRNARRVSSADAAEYSVTRRAIILLTDGVDNASSRKIDEAIERAWRSGVIIFAIGIGDRFRFEGVREDVLVRLSEETGGRAFFPQNAADLNTHFRQIESELRSQYLAAYSPANLAKDGTFRRIEVRLPARKDARIIHRRGYYAPLESEKK